MANEHSSYNAWEVFFRILVNLGLDLVVQFGLFKVGVLGISVVWPTTAWAPFAPDMRSDAPGQRRIVVEEESLGARTRSEAARDAEKRAYQQLEKELGALAKEISGRELTPPEVLQEKVWLLKQPGVKLIETTGDPEEKYLWDSIERSLYYKGKHGFTLEIPEEVLARWATRLAREPFREVLGFLCLLGAIAFGWLLGLGLMVKLDRLSGGYYRGLIVSVHLAGLMFISAVVVVWWMTWVSNFWWMPSPQIQPVVKGVFH
jgi:hypothetical protein